MRKATKKQLIVAIPALRQAQDKHAGIQSSDIYFIETSLFKILDQ